LNKLQTIFQKNGYPDRLIARFICRTDVPESRQSQGNPGVSDSISERPKDDRRVALLRLPYIGKISSKFERSIRQSVEHAYPSVRVVVVYTTQRAAQVRKDALPILQKSSLIYNFECRNCVARYIGRTFPHLGARIRQHVPLHLLPSTERTSRPTRGRPRHRNNVVMSSGGGVTSTAPHHATTSTAAEDGRETDTRRDRDETTDVTTAPEMVATNSHAMPTPQPTPVPAISNERRDEMDVTTEPVKRRRGRPRKEESTPSTAPTPAHTEPTESTILRSGRVVEGVVHTSDCRHGVDHYSSAVAKHLVSDESCRELYRDSDFSILAHGRSEFHIKVLEGVYLRMFDPSLCKQKKVWTVKLFPR